MTRTIRRRLFALFVAAAVTLAAQRALADEKCPLPEKPDDQCVVKIVDGGKTEGGAILPPGYYLTPETWERLDVEVKRLQEAETRLTAERDSYRKDARPAWWWAAGALAAGFALGWALNR